MKKMRRVSGAFFSYAHHLSSTAIDSAQGVNMHNRMKKIAIIGGGTAGWMTAAAFAKALIPAGYKVVLVESTGIGSIGVGEATIPTIKSFNALLGFDEYDFMKNTMATYKLGIQFRHWGCEGNHYFHPFGGIGVPHGPLPFYHYWLKAYLQKQTSDLGLFSIATMAARHNKFSPPVSQPGHPLQRLDYAYHFDASLYAAYLRRFAEKSGVTRIEGIIEHVVTEPEKGFIDSVTLQSGDIVSADFFIDCTGFNALLIEKTLRTGYEYWDKYLLCDSALAVQSVGQRALAPYTRSTAHTAGWQWEIPLQHRNGNGHVYASSYMDDETACRVLLQNSQGEALGEPRVIRFKTGMRKKMWNQNCVAIGLSAGFLEPLESTSIHLIQAAIVKLITHFPAADFSEADSDEYNRQMADDYRATRDFIILHYKANRRCDSEFWRYCQSMAIPDTLENRLEAYRASGRLHIKPADIFKEESWVSVLQGQGIVPADYHPLADAISDSDLSTLLMRLHTLNEKAVAAMPRHAEFIARYCVANKSGKT
jgi:tryptophan 7-halogenase